MQHLVCAFKAVPTNVAAAALLNSDAAGMAWLLGCVQPQAIQTMPLVALAQQQLWC
jgi:hypothetical protein